MTATPASTPTSTHAPTTDRGSDRRPGPARLTAPGIVRSEWLRLATTRSTLVTLLAAGAVMALIGMLAAAVATGSVADPAGGPAPGFDDSDPMGTLMAGSTMVVLIIGVLGVMVGAREYNSGLVRTTYAAVPRRWPVLVTRVGVFAAASLVVIGIGTLLAFAGGNALLAANDGTTASLGDDGVVRALVGNVVYLVGTGVIGIALGTLTRSIGLGIGALVALVIVVPGLGGALLPDSWQSALDYLPSQAAVPLTTVTPSSDYLGVAAGAVVLIVWVVGLVAAAVAGLLRRDV
jgi:ABC-type transport system involved in multi-copper enzyme maturation permease subunit